MDLQQPTLETTGAVTATRKRDSKPTGHVATHVTPDARNGNGNHASRNSRGKKKSSAIALFACAAFGREAAIAYPGDRERNLDAVGHVTRMHYGEWIQQRRSPSKASFHLVSLFSLSLFLFASRARAGVTLTYFVHVKAESSLHPVLIAAACVFRPLYYTRTSLSRMRAVH